MDFKKYNSVENTYFTEFMDSVQSQGFGDLEYVVQEKVHGANLCLMTDGTEIVCAKRTEVIKPGEEFYGHEYALEKYKTGLLNLFSELKNTQGCKQVTVFGELIGGGYPHPSVATTEGAKLVQRGIYYCPWNDFYTFDILINESNYLSVAEAELLLEKHGFLFAKTLFKGSLAECLEYPNAFPTTLPAQLGLPLLKGNICEGVVIRPLAPCFLTTGSRVFFKNKNEAWAENNNFIDRQLLSKLLHEGEDLSEAATILCEEIYKHITKNRLENLLSKIGKVDPKKDLGKILGLYNKDVLSDFMKAFGEQYNALEKHEAKAINKFLNKHAGILIGEYFLG